MTLPVRPGGRPECCSLISLGWTNWRADEHGDAISAFHSCKSGGHLWRVCLRGCRERGTGGGHSRRARRLLKHESGAFVCVSARAFADHQEDIFAGIIVPQCRPACLLASRADEHA
jgi:hypothetical protein